MLHYRGTLNTTRHRFLCYLPIPPYSECYDRATRATPVFNVCGHGWHARMACHPKACHVPDALNPSRLVSPEKGLSVFGFQI